MNNRMRVSLRASIRIWGVTTALVGFAACLHANARCDNSTWRGAYAVVLNGFRTLQQPPQLIGAFSPVAIVGTFTFDGDSNVQRSISVSAGGLDFLVVDAGTYAVNPDCSGTITFSDAGESFSLAAIDTKTLSVVTATLGESGAGTLVKQQDQSCDLRRLRGTYVFNGSGWGAFQDPPVQVDGFFPVAVSGFWIFDGKGSVSRNLNLSFFGLAFPYEDTGTYQVKPDCSASAYFTSDLEPFEMIFVDNSTLFTSAGTVPGVSRVGAATLTKQHLDD